ncbi:hypothetical protein SAMN04490355_1004128 [Pelosinus propionicus DSM 13327]|uniref:Uncharacterized protein n=1 Tax=Pelosinus propionicus DSM 13327 TaxID=1123291 RepID=A0A1I4HN92_9FIRM|nr:hypothetical protein SAMN04490355_1004128 [Pelosinus propionicus DSM 13327]
MHRRSIKTISIIINYTNSFMNAEDILEELEHQKNDYNEKISMQKSWRSHMLIFLFLEL